MSLVVGIVMVDANLFLAIFALEVIRTPLFDSRPIRDHVDHHNWFLIKIYVKKVRPGHAFNLVNVLVLFHEAGNRTVSLGCSRCLNKLLVRSLY